MVISLSAELEELVRRKVDSGFYDSPSQVIEEALFLLEEQSHFESVRRDRLLRVLADGVFQANNRQLIGSAEVFANLSHQDNLASE